MAGDGSDLPHAGLGDRALAWMVDGLLVLLMTFFCLRPILWLVGNLLPASVLDGIVIVVFLLISGVYYTGLEARWSQTLGKLLLGLKVVHIPDGKECTPRGAIVRNITKVLGANPVSIILAVLMVRASPKSQRVGDVLGDTTVIVT